MKKRKIIWQIYPTYLILVIISLITIGWVGFSSFKSFFLAQATQDLESRARIFQHQLNGRLLSTDPEQIDILCKQIGTASDTRITVVLPNGRVVGDSDEDPKNMDLHSTREEILAAKKQHVGSSIRYSSTLQQKMMYVALPLMEKDRIIGILRMSIPIEDIDSQIQAVWFKLAFGGIVIAAVMAGVALLVARRLSRPIREMKIVAQRFAEGDLTQKAAVYETEELTGLSDAMNRMASDLNERINTIISQRNELETVLSSMMEGVLAIDNDEKIIKINASAATMLDIDPEACKGRSIQEIIRNISFQKFVSKALLDIEAVETDITFYRNDLERILKMHSSPITNAEGKKIGTLIVMDDVSKLRRLENVRRDFVANVSHEIKTPLTAIKGFVETLYHDMAGQEDDAKRFLAIILKHVDRLNAIVDDLLSLSRIEREKDGKEILLQQSDIKDVIETAVQVCMPKAKEKNIIISTATEAPVMANIDVTLLEQAMVNIIDNAIKYSDADSTVDIEAKETDKDIAIEITDHGIGISKEHLPRLFERFYRVDKARSRKMGGTGLGLSIVKHIVQAHGGTIEADSRLGSGSTFTIRLPKHVTDA